MLIGEINPDAIEGTDNLATIAAIRSQLSSCSDRVPFLLLPVRVETRFMRVTRPIAGEPELAAERLLEDLRTVELGLVELDSRELRIDGAPTHKLRKAREAEIHQQVEASLAKIADGSTRLRDGIDASATATPEVSAALAQLARSLPGRLRNADARLGQLRSNYKRQRYGRQLRELGAELDAVVEVIGAALVPKFELLRELVQVPVASVSTQIATVEAALAQAPADAGPPMLLGAAGKVAQALVRLRDLTHAVIRGAEDTLAQLHRRWTNVEQRLRQLERSLATIVDPRLRKQAAALERELGNRRRELAGLGGDSRRFKQLDNETLMATARAFTQSKRELESLAGKLSIDGVRRGVVDREAMRVSEELAATARRVAALNAEIAILPEQKRVELDALAGQIAKQFDVVSPTLDSLARTRTTTLQPTKVGTLAARLEARSKTGLTQLSAALAGQRTDQLGTDAVLGDRTIFWIGDRLTRTSDELWVRVFPDDLAVHTHEQALTEAEIEDGKVFWVQTHAAKGDRKLELAAWRALAKLHGSNRAAWIARRLQPTQIAATTQAATQLIASLEALDKRIAENTQSLTAFMGAVDTHVARIDKAVAVAEAALVRVEHGTPEQLERARSLARSVVTRVAALRSRALRTDGFASQPVEPSKPVASTRPVPTRPLQPTATKPTTIKPTRPIASKPPASLDKLYLRVRELDAKVRGIEAIDPRQSLASSLVFPDVETKDGTWTVAPHSRVLPDRFVALTVRGGQVTHAVAGKSIGELQVGIDPADPSAGFELDDDGDLIVPAQLEWLTNYRKAVDAGMAISVPISSTEATAGFDEVLVLGVKSSSAEQAKLLVEQLIDNHHYGETGVSLLPIGTPTNNTEDREAGHSSRDDHDASFAVEREAPLFELGVTDPLVYADGLRFARALGIDPAILTHVANAGGTDIGDAMRMNAALWPATIGGFLDDFWTGLVSPDTAERARRFFVEHVSARGQISALRIGTQPYGVLTTTAFSRFSSRLGSVLPSNPTTETQRQLRFELLLNELLRVLAEDWSRLRAQYVAHAHSEGVEDSRAHFMQMLGLTATSSSFQYRFSLNCATRQPPGLADDDTQVHLEFGHSPYGPIGFLIHFVELIRRAFGLAEVPVIDDRGQVRAEFSPIMQLLHGDRVHRLRHLQQARSLRGPLAELPGGAVTKLLAATVASLVTDSQADRAIFGNSGNKTWSLLGLLLRHALALRMREAARDILLHESLLTTEVWPKVGSGDHFFIPRGMFGADDPVTKWNYLFEPIAALDGRFDLEFPNGNAFVGHLGNRSLADYLANRGGNQLFSAFNNAAHSQIVAGLQAHAAVVASLASIPTARLEAALREHLDLCSYRQDAWQLGLANQRLAEIRREQTSGVFLGAFGWLENVWPDRTTSMAEGVPPELLRDGERLRAAAEQGGFIHTPSLTHAVTAAILRSGYLAEVDDPDLDNRLAVNLSSRRVRLALEILDGVRAGLELGAVLGYRFERALQDAPPQLGLSQFVFGFRRAFPAAAAVDPSDTGSAALARRLVVDGLALLDAINDWIETLPESARHNRTVLELLHGDGSFAGYPWGLIHQGEVLVPSTGDGERLYGVCVAIDQMADALDALGDLALSESIYQIVRGNHVRAAGVLAALAEGKPLPRPEIIDTPRSGTLVNHRVVLPLPRVDGALLSRHTVANQATRDGNRRAALMPAWQAVPSSPRSLAEPSLNRWLAGLIGAPDQIRVCFEHPVSGAESELDVGALGLQPLDLLAMFGPGLQEGEAELAARIMAEVLTTPPDLAALPEAGITPKLLLRRRGVGWTSEQRSLYELAPLLGRVHELLGSSRAAVVETLQINESAVPAGEGQAAPIDAAELEARARGMVAELRIVARELAMVFAPAPATDIAELDVQAWLREHQAALTDPTIVGRIPELGALLMRVAAFDVPQAIPPIHFANPEQVVRGYRAAVANALVEVVARIRAADAQLLAGKFQASLQAMLGEGFTVVPHFVPVAPEQLQASATDPALLGHAGPFAMDRWLLGIASVRDRLAVLRDIVLLADGFGATVPEPQPAQLPHVASEPWLGVELPAATITVSDKASIVTFATPGFVWDPTAKAALLIDEWTEVIPRRQETTAVAFHYDQPDATAPQSLLLAVPPKLTGKWNWDDLVHTLHDTFELARNRTVELEHLDGETYSQFLPLLMAELVPRKLDGEPLGDARLVLDFGLNNKDAPQED